MNAIINGDVIDSRNQDSKVWMPMLKKLLNQWGKSPQDWELVYGDSFQLLVSDPSDVLEIVFKIKAEFRSLDTGNGNYSGIDVRMGIGLGEIANRENKIIESNGSAFLEARAAMEISEKERCNMIIKSNNREWDEQINLYFELCMRFMDDWTRTSASMVKSYYKYPALTQNKLAKKLKITQSAVSKRWHRAGISEMKKVDEMYRHLYIKNFS